MLKAKVLRFMARPRAEWYSRFFLNLTSLLFLNKHKVLPMLYARSVNTKGIYVQVLNIGLEDLISKRPMYIARELVNQGYICLIISPNIQKASEQWKEVESNIFVAGLTDIILNIKDSIISIDSNVFPHFLEQIEQVKRNNNKIIYEYTEQPTHSNPEGKFNKTLLNEKIDFTICTTSSLTKEMQHYLPVDKVLYSPNPKSKDHNIWKDRVKSLVRCITFIIPAPSNLRPLPDKLQSVDDKLLDVQAEIARSIVSDNNLYYRHCEKLYFYPVLNWLNDKIKGGKVLDIGCAYGTLAILLSKHFSCDVYTLDFMDHFYPASLFDKYNIKFKCINIEVDDIPYKEKFDLVILTEVLEHFNFYPTPTLKKIAASMNDDGILILTTPDASEWGHTKQYYNSLEEIPYPKIQNNYIDDHVWQYNKDELEKVIAEAGFEILTIEYAPGMPFVGRHFCVKLKRSN